MFSNILLAVDGSEASLAATRQGIDLAVALKARITVVTVTVPWTVHFASELAVVVQDAVVSKDEYDARQEANANCISHNVASDARSAGVLVKTVYRSHPEPYVAILNVAVTEGCDLIVVGCHQARARWGCYRAAKP